MKVISPASAGLFFAQNFLNPVPDTCSEQHHAVGRTTSTQQLSYRMKATRTSPLHTTPRYALCFDTCFLLAGRTALLDITKLRYRQYHYPYLLSYRMKVDDSLRIIA